MDSLFSLTFLLGLSVTRARGLDFKPVFEWKGFELNWTSETKALKNGSYNPEKIEPRYLAVHQGKIFLSLSSQQGVPSTLAWLPADASSTSPALNPYPSWPHQGQKSCASIESARGIEVDTLGRLWALDDGDEKKCPPKLWIFNLTSNAVELSYPFPDSAVSHSFTWQLGDLVLDETDSDWFAYAAEIYTKHLVVFSLQQQKSWRVVVQKYKVNAIALSPTGDRRKLYFCERDESNNIFSVNVRHLRAGVTSVSAVLEGTKTGRTNRMTMDSHGILYYDLKHLKCLASWQTNAPFKEELIYEESDIKSESPIMFAFDTMGDLWLLAKYSEGKAKLSKALVGSKSYSYTSSSEKSKSSGYGENADHERLLLLNIVLSCWNVFSLIFTAVQIFSFRRLKRMQDASAKPKRRRVRMSTPPVDRQSLRSRKTKSEPVYEEIDPVPSTSACSKVAETKL